MRQRKIEKVFGLVKVLFENKKYYCGPSCALRISVDRPLCAVSVFVTYTVANQQALLPRQAESAAVVQRLYTDVRREPYEPSAAKHWQNLKYWVSRFGDGRLNPNSLLSQPNRT